MLFVVGIVVAVQVLGGPSSANTPEGVVDRYLAASQDNDLDEVKKNSCAKDVSTIAQAQSSGRDISGATVGGKLESWDIGSANVTGDSGKVSVTIKGESVLGQLEKQETREGIPFREAYRRIGEKYRK